ncbi:MAG: hypothetical protein KDB29_08130, partial [Planctomycetes bacterium]|nr:hypothetical protein [Planctomycetota bacterium]
MAEPSITQLRRKLGWYFAFTLGAATAFAVLVGVMAFVPGAGNNLVVWGTVFGFCVLVVAIFAAIAVRLRSVEKAFIDNKNVRNTGQLLAEQVQKREKAEASLREEALLPDFSPGPVLRFDTHGRITRFNSAAQELITDEPLDGKTVQELLPDLSDEDVENCVRAGVIEPREVKWRNQWFICHLRGVPELSVGLLYASDNTQGKETEIELRHMERRARAILDGAADSIIIVV